MADASGNRGLGSLTIGVIAGVAVVLGGVALFQSGVLQPRVPQAEKPKPEPAAVQDGGGGLAADGGESGQPLKDSAVAAAAGDGAPKEAEPAQGPAGNAAEELPVTGGDGSEKPQKVEQEAALAAEPPAAAEDPAGKAEVFVLQAPELDLVRVDSDGAAVIAGRAQAGVRVFVLLDGKVLTELEVPPGGEFVSLADIAPSSEARVVSLRAEHDGQRSASEATFILAPAGPLDVAQGGPEQEATGTSAEGGEGPAAGPDLTAEPEAPQLQGQAVAVLRADQEGVHVVQPASPGILGLSDEVALDAISYNGTGGVELTGRARPQSRVRIYVDNQPVAELEAAEDGRWTGRLEDLAPGIYTLRLDEIEPASGTVLSRVETPFKREAPGTLPLPGGDAAPGQPAPLVRAVTVQKGDTLWAISREKYGSGLLYVRLFEANRGAIRDPDLIYPGQVFSIPE